MVMMEPRLYDVPSTGEKGLTLFEGYWQYATIPHRNKGSKRDIIPTVRRGSARSSFEVSYAGVAHKSDAVLENAFKVTKGGYS